MVAIRDIELTWCSNFVFTRPNCALRIITTYFRHWFAPYGSFAQWSVQVIHSTRIVSTCLSTLIRTRRIVGACFAQATHTPCLTRTCFASVINIHTHRSHMIYTKGPYTMFGVYMFCTGDPYRCRSFPYLICTPYFILTYFTTSDSYPMDRSHTHVYHGSIPNESFACWSVWCVQQLQSTLNPLLCKIFAYFFIKSTFIWIFLYYHGHGVRYWLSVLPMAKKKERGWPSNASIFLVLILPHTTPLPAFPLIEHQMQGLWRDTRRRGTRWSPGEGKMQAGQKAPSWRKIPYLESRPWIFSFERVRVQDVTSTTSDPCPVKHDK